VLAPHYSRLSIAGYRDQLDAGASRRAELRMIESWHDFEPFVDVLAARVRGTNAHVVFTAHSLPARVLEEGDPYQDQLLETWPSRCGAAQSSATGRSPTKVKSRQARPGWARTSSDHLDDLHARGVAPCACALSASSPTTWRSAGTSTSKRRTAARELGMTLQENRDAERRSRFVRALTALVEQELGTRAPG
jgi:ferrochelatase